MQSFTTTQGMYKSSKYYIGENIFFPDFCKSRKIPEISFRLFGSLKSRYDIIIGRDVSKYGFVLDHARSIILWDGLSIEMTRATSHSSNMDTSFSCALTATSVYASSTEKILHAKYKKTSLTEVINKCHHLNTVNKAKLLELLSSFPKLFSGDLGRYVHKKCSISLKDPYTLPIFCNPYPIPIIHQPVFKKELQHLIEAKVLKRIERSEWAFPTFLIPKKDGRVRWISDFRRLNKLITRSRYFLPNIPAIMQKRSGFLHITKLDISMGF